MSSNLFEFHWSDYWRWPSDSPLIGKVARTPPILSTLQHRTTMHQSPPSTGRHLMVLVEAGICVIGEGFEEESRRLARHRRYMTRKSQGRAQISFQPKGGRLSYGARLRQRESRTFFKDVITSLEEVIGAEPIHHVWWHCPPRIKGYLRQEEPRVMSKLEAKASKLPGPTDIFCDEAIEQAWRRLTFGSFNID